MLTIENAVQSLRSLRWVIFPVVLVVVFALWLFRDPFGELPDFSAIDDVTTLKRQFYSYMKPIIANENQSIALEREGLLSLKRQLERGETLGFLQRRKLATLAENYEIDWDPDTSREILETLLQRVDVIPEALALAQAAKESGWGRSRFAREGNNLFGQWCYVKGCGIVPKNRASGANHEVADFASVSQAVRYYLHNLNTHPSYDDLRQRRRRMRQRGEALDPVKLAEGLLFYSERREAYVAEIQAMVRQFQKFATEGDTQ